MSDALGDVLSQLGPVAPSNWFTRLLWFCAGADGRLLERCPHSDRVKFEGVGGIVLATGLLASLSGGYAFYTVFSPKDATALNQSLDFPSLAVALFAGAIWGLVIFNLDRFIVSSTGKGDGTDKMTFDEWIHAVPRLVMAVVIGVCISAPLEIRILKPEIDAQLELEQNEYRATLDAQASQAAEARKTELRGKVTASQGRLDDQTAYFEKRRIEINDQRRQLELEAEGLTGSGSPGRGPAWQDKKDTLDKLEEELGRDRAADATMSGAGTSEIAGWKSELDEIETKLAETEESNLKQARHLDGLQRRIKISHEIGGPVPWLIMALLLCVETGPIFFKMMLIKGVYDYADENARRIALARFGIELSSVGFLDGGKKEVRMDTFHQAEAILGEEQRRLDTEESLSKKAHKKFQAETSAKIEDDLSSFLVDTAKPKG